MKRHGTVIVFKPGTTPEEAVKALEKIADVLDFPEFVYDYKLSATEGDQRVRRPSKLIDFIHDFDDKLGGPVWYLP